MVELRKMGEMVGLALGWTLVAIGCLLGAIATCAFLWVMYRQSPLIAVLMATVVLPWLLYTYWAG